MIYSIYYLTKKNKILKKKILNKVYFCADNLETSKHFYQLTPITNEFNWNKLKYIYLLMLNIAHLSAQLFLFINIYNAHNPCVRQFDIRCGVTSFKNSDDKSNIFRYNNLITKKKV